MQNNISLIYWTSATAFAVQMALMAGMAHAGGSCDKKNGIATIGLEYIAQICPASDDDEIYYTVDPFSCQNNAILPYSSYGSLPATPRSLKESTQSSQFRVFSNAKGTHVILVGKNYTGTLNIDQQFHSPAIPLPSGAGCAEPVVLPTDLTGPGLPPCNVTNPINPAWRGNKYQEQVDYRANGAFPLQFSRSYNSRATRVPHHAALQAGIISIGSVLPRDFGLIGGLPNPPVANYIVSPEGAISVGAGDAFGISGQWVHNYSMRIEKLSPAGDRIAIYRADGPALLLGKIGAVWKPVTVSNDVMSEAPAIAEKLSTVTDANNQVIEWNLTNSDNTVETYNAAGQLTRLTYVSGLRQTLSYVNGRLDRVVHSNGQSLIFAYNGKNQIDTLTLPDGLKLAYQYDNYNNLTRITWPDDTPLDATDNPYTSYLYEKPASPRALTGIADSGIRYATWGYDSQGRATVSEHAGGADRAVVTYDPLNPDKASITEPAGAVRGYTYGTRANRRVITAINQPAGAGCNASTSALGYDANGNVNSRTDFNNHTTTWVYEPTRNLETRRTEASGTPNQRIIDTEWHATWRLPTKITEPGRITAFEYDTRAQLKKKTVTDTTPTTPVDRVTLYTNEYNADVANPYLKKVTVNGPRTDLSDIVVYDYDSQGNLATMTQNVQRYTGGPVSTLITRYGDYDANGRVGLITAPNAVKTRLRYWPRGWLKTRILGEGLPTAQTTTFDYYGTGLLKKVTNPDASWIEYVYDNAHRLTDIRDQAGNFIHYTLDSAGNRTKEEVNDISGALAAALQQVNLAQADSRVPSVGESL